MTRERCFTTRKWGPRPSQKHFWWPVYFFLLVSDPPWTVLVFFCCGECTPRSPYHIGDELRDAVHSVLKSSGNEEKKTVWYVEDIHQELLSNLSEFYNWELTMAVFVGSPKCMKNGSATFLWKVEVSIYVKSVWLLTTMMMTIGIFGPTSECWHWGSKLQLPRQKGMEEQCSIRLPTTIVGAQSPKSTELAILTTTLYIQTFQALRRLLGLLTVPRGYQSLTFGKELNPWAWACKLLN